MILQFHDVQPGDAHEAFQRWRHKNSAGFFINCRTREEWKIHRVTCQHLGNTNWGDASNASLTRLKKVCSRDLSELIDWARRNDHPEPTLCQNCLVADEANGKSAVQIPPTEEVEFTPRDVADAREWIRTSIARRQGQKSFRERVLQAYGRRCAISGCMTEAILDAAHILPYNGPSTNHITNGILLRTDLHTLFDLRLIMIDPDSFAVIVSPEVRDEAYRRLNGKPIRLPKREADRPRLDIARMPSTVYGRTRPPSPCR